MRTQWERSQFADVETSVDITYKEIDRLKLSDQLREAIYDLVGQLTIDNRFIIAEFPDFPDHSLTQSEITLLESELRELAFTLDHEEKIRSAFLAQLKVLLDTLVKCYPEGTGNFTVPLHALIDTPALVQRLFYLLLEEFVPFDRATSLAFAATANQLYENYEATKQTKPLESKLSPDECITTYLAGTPFVEFLNQTCPFEIPDKVRPEHVFVCASTGTGKSQFIQADVYYQLQKHERPGMVVIDSQGTMLPKIEALDLWRDDLIIIDPEDINPPALNMFALPERIKSYDRNTQEVIESRTIQLFGFLFAALDQSLTGRQSTFFSFVTRLVLSIPGATIRTLREMLEEEPKTPEQSQFWPYVQKLDPDAQAFFKKQFYQKGYNVETKRGIVQRLYGILRVPAFNRMFTATDNQLDIFNELNAGKTILVNTSKALLGDDASSVFARYVIAQTLSAAFQRVAITPPYRLALLYIDEASEVMKDETLATLFTQARKFELGALIAFQNLQQMPAGLAPEVLANTTTKLVAGLTDRDARALATDMRTSSDWLLSLRKQRDASEFGCFIKNYTPHAVRLTIPFGVIENAPKMSAEEHKALRQRNRERYGTSSNANVNHENSLSQTHEAPATQASNEVSRPHPPSVSTTPPPTRKPATDPHAGIDD